MAPLGDPLGSSLGDETLVSEAVAMTAPVGGILVLRLADGGEGELEVPAHLCHLIRPGISLILYHDPGGELLGWYVPDRGIGLDLRP
jgi:hypothetical protein